MNKEDAKFFFKEFGPALILVALAIFAIGGVNSWAIHQINNRTEFVQEHRKIQDGGVGIFKITNEKVMVLDATVQDATDPIQYKVRFPNGTTGWVNEFEVIEQ